MRSPDMIDTHMIAAPIAFIAGLVYDDATAEDASRLLKERAADLVTAGRDGLRDNDIAAGATDLADLAIAGCRSLGESYISHEDLDTLIEFVDRYTRHGKSPADDQ